MRKLALFFRVFWKSISSLSYYHEVIKTPFRFSLKYFLVFSFLLGVLLTTIISSVIFPFLTTFTSRVNSRTQTLFPTDLVIEIKDGRLTANQSEPIHFPIPFELFMDVPPAISDQKQLYLVTIDTHKKPSDFKTAKSIILVTQEAITVSEGNDESNYRIYPLKEFGNIRVDHEIVTTALRSLKSVITSLPYMFVLFIGFLCILILPLGQWLFLFIVTLFVLPAARLMRLSFSYQKLVQIGLHALTFPTLIQLALLFLGLMPPVPFFGTILYYLYTLVILAELSRSAVIK